jgi:hypothetical protein
MAERFEAGLDIALRDIVRVTFADGGRSVGRVIALLEVPNQPTRASVDTPRGEWRGLAREVVVVRRDETNRLWRDGASAFDAERGH